MFSDSFFFSIIGSLIMALGAVLWFFFQRMHKKLDAVATEIVTMTKEYKDKIHAMENRLSDKLDKLEGEHYRTREDMSKLFTRVGTLEGFVHGAHKKEFPKPEGEPIQ